MLHPLKQGGQRKDFMLDKIILELRHEETCFLHICENLGADQLHGNPAADHAFVFAT